MMIRSLKRIEVPELLRLSFFWLLLTVGKTALSAATTEVRRLAKSSGGSTKLYSHTLDLCQHTAPAANHWRYTSLKGSLSLFGRSGRCIRGPQVYGSFDCSRYGSVCSPLRVCCIERVTFVIFMDSLTFALVRQRCGRVGPSGALREERPHGRL